MKRTLLRLPSACFRLEAPPEVLAEIRKIYPVSFLSSSKAPGTPPTDTVRIEPCGEQFQLCGDGPAAGRARTAERAALLAGLVIEQRLIALRGRRLAVHAGAVTRQRRACLIAGTPESGKTACTFQLVEAGWSHLAEEVSLIDRAGRVEPFPQALCLADELLAEHRASYPLAGGSLAPGAPGFSWYHPTRTATAPRRITTVLLPRYRPDAQPELRRRPASEVLVEFLGYCFAPLGSDEEQFDRVMDLVERASVFEIRYRDVRSARALLTQALATS